MGWNCWEPEKKSINTQALMERSRIHVYMYRWYDFHLNDISLVERTPFVKANMKRNIIRGSLVQSHLKSKHITSGNRALKTELWKPSSENWALKNGVLQNQALKKRAHHIKIFGKEKNLCKKARKEVNCDWVPRWRIKRFNENETH